MVISETVEVKRHEKCIFENPHNEIKCVLNVKESNFNEKKSTHSHLFTVYGKSSDGIIDGDGPKECDDPRGFEKLKVIEYGFWRSKILSWYTFHALMDCLS